MEITFFSRSEVYCATSSYYNVYLGMWSLIVQLCYVKTSCFTKASDEEYFICNISCTGIQMFGTRR